MTLTADEEGQIHKTIEPLDDEEPAGVLKGDTAAQSRIWAEDMIVNAPHNQVVRLAEVLERTKQQTALQYSSFERHREATINRRYTNIYYLDDGA